MKETLELEIEKLSFGGDGIGRKDGLVYFVPLSAPGDLVKIQVTEKKKNFARAEVLEVLKPGPSRIKPACPVFGRCGGCTWQHVSYEEQLRQKQMIVEEQLGRSLGVDLKVQAIIPSPQQFRYRNRIQLKYDGKNIGFYARQSHDVIDIQDCPITEETLTAEIPGLKKTLSQKKAAAIPKIEVLLTSAGKVETVFEDSPFEGVGFSQVNTWQNKNLMTTVLDWMKGSSAETIYDLYAGAGNFSFPLLEQFPKSTIIGVELNDKSVRIAQNQIQSRNLSPHRMRFYLADVELYLKRTVLQEGSIVLLDPPRNGCSENTLRYLSQQKLQKIFYISCNPAALARDLERLRQWGSWETIRVQPFDMFPQTDHVETLVELTRRTSAETAG
jgi:23S rRNA (uracil1939-C5)-methyltransferase